MIKPSTLAIRQSDTGVSMTIDGDFPDLVCSLAVLYKTVALRGAALGIDVPRLVDLMCDDSYIESIAYRFHEETEGV